MKSRPSRRAGLAIGALIGTAIITVSAGIASGADKVIVFYTQCDEMSATATVKVKRINEDGTEPVTIGDTGIAHCADGSTPSVFHTGFAVSGAYGYFAWQKSDDSGGGIGRIKLDGTAAAERNWATIGSPIQSIQMSPRSIGGHLFFYADDGPAPSYGALNPRIMQVKLADATVSELHKPTASEPGLDVRYMSFGVGKDAIYYSTDISAARDLDKVSLGGTRTAAAFTFANETGDGFTLQFLNGRGANLIAESDDTMFLYAQRAFDPFTMGISTVGTSGSFTGVEVHKAVPGTNGQPPADFPVWGGNFLYYKNGDGKHISRTTKTGAVENNVFPSIVKPGWVHHISPASAAAVTVTPPTTPTTPTTPSTVAPQTTKPAAVAPTVPKKGGLTAAKIASYLKLTVPKGAKVGISVAAASKKTCAVKSGKLVALKTGSCRVTATVTPKTGKSQRASVTLKTS